jgi:predicted ATPase
MRDRNPRRAAEHLRAALALWRGRPFGELGVDGTLRVEADRLEGLHVHARELRIEADLALGASAELVDELEALTASHPYHESFWRQLMLALYRSERQADALAAYHRARRTLDEDLGIEPGLALRELETAILRQDVPTPGIPGERHNLPAQITSFVGRERELADVAALLREHRLVTLTGVGGVGKTRLGIEAARAVAEDVPDGAWFVDLAPLADPSMVPGHVCAALDVREVPGTQPADRLVAHLRDRALLLVLDNCEHLRDGIAQLATTLLASRESIRVLATSREVLGVAGEAEYQVPTLSLPTALDSPEEIRRSEAVRLFMARAREARPGLADDDETMATIARICADLDGLPLAVELAAARARVLSAAEIGERLQDRFRFLVSWRRLVTARHRTLLEAMDWSYELLDPDAQRLLAELSVFKGGFTLEAVQRVCSGRATDDALELVGRLVESSLVIVDQAVEPTRYRLLETVRQYGADRLRSAGRMEEMRDRHARQFAAAAEAAWQPLRSGVRAEWLARIDEDRDNFRAALSWSLERGDHDRALRIAEALWWKWWIRGELTEGRTWLQRSLEGAGASEKRLRARGLLGLAGLGWAMGDYAGAEPPAQEAARLFDELGDHMQAGSSRNTLGLLAEARGDPIQARALYESAIERYMAPEVDPGLRRRNLSVTIDNLGSAAHALGDDEDARRRYEEARAINVEIGDEEGVAMNDLHLAILDAEAGHWPDARRRLGSALALYRRVDFQQYAGECLEGAAVVANALGAPREAAFALGAAAHIQEQIGHPPVSFMAGLRERELAAARAALTEAEYQAIVAEGLAASVDAAIERVLRFLEDRAERTR